MGTYVLLAAAIMIEVAGTICLQVSHGFSRLLPSAAALVSYAASIVLLGQVLKRGLFVAVVYAIWSGVGVTMVAVIGAIWFGQRLTMTQLFGLVLVIGGVVALEAGRT